MKAIILAAGSSRRFGSYLHGRPKCTLQLGGRSLLQHQLHALRSAGVCDIVLVKGYQAEQLVVPGTRSYCNSDYQITNMVHSLFCAESEIEGDVIIAYADIVYEARIIRQLMASKHAITVAADRSWAQYYGARYGNPFAEAESFVIRENGSISEIGAPEPLHTAIDAQYIGLIRLNPQGSREFRASYAKSRSAYSGRIWLRNRVFESAHMTDFLQGLIEDGVQVYSSLIDGGWLEFDSPADYERVQGWIQSGTLDRFYKIDPDENGDGD